jgi:long-chain acyl-CoA synthetase
VVADAAVAEAVAVRRAGLPHLKHVLTLDSDGPIPGAASFRALVKPAETWPDVEVGETDLFVIMYTSGTTGRPKGCITTHEGTIAQLRLVLLNGLIDKELGSGRAGEAPPPGRPRRQPALLATSPFFHVSGLHSAICLSILTGSKVVLTSGRFDPAEVLRLVEAERITAWGGVPTMIHRVVDCPAIHTTDLSSLETVVSGGAPLPPDVLERAREHLGAKASLGNGYGLTETHGAVTMNAGRGLVDRPDSVGRPSPLVDLRIVAGDGRVADTGTVGEIQVRSVISTPGYWNRPADNAELFADGGWLRTGDLGFVDGDGFLHLADRLKDMIIRGGENVYCIEVEDALGAAPEVDEAAVFGVPDPDLGERVAAVVHLVPGASTNGEALRESLAGRLARYKIPDRIVITQEPLPRNATGKIDKADLRARHGAALARKG